MRLLTTVVSLALLAGCDVGGGSGDLVSESSLPKLVLQPGDLSDDWTRFDEGRQARADTPAGPRSDLTRFGRVGGWKARYRRAGSPETQGPLVVESRADLFEEQSGAEQDFDAAAEALGADAEPVTLGDEARRTVSAGREGELANVVLLWRHGNVVASLTLNGFSGRLTGADALELGRAQQSRIAAAG